MEQTSAFEGFCIVEIFGHSKAIGYCTTQYFGQTALFRVDTPELPDREYELKRREYADGQYLPIGAKVKRQGRPASSQLLGPGSIFRMTPCTEEVMLQALEEMIPRPLILLSLPEGLQIESGNPDAEDDDIDDRDHEAY